MSSSDSRRRGPGFVTPNACTECRKKRTKCDGQTPCTRCASLNIPDCIYEVPIRQSKDEMRSQIEQLQLYQQQSQSIFQALKSGHRSEDIISQLQNGDSMEDISGRLTRIASNPAGYELLHNSFQDMMSAVPNFTNSSGTTYGDGSVFVNPYEGPPDENIFLARQFGQQVILGDEQDLQAFSRDGGPNFSNDSWTTITLDRALVEHLLALYFCWEYPIFATVSKEHFMEDFRKGIPRYCSSLLVNALLALGCRFSDRASTRSNPDDHTTAGDTFFAEALRLFEQEWDHHTLTTIQALGLMSIREISCGRISESYFLSTQSIRLAVEMGLHMASNSEHENEDERFVRASTFWGALSLNEMLSLCTGNLPHLSRRINFPTKPAIVPQIEDAIWTPYTDDGTPLDVDFDQPSNLRSVYRTFCELSEKVHHVLHTLYSPSSKVDSRTLIAMYNEYIQWFDTIPESLRLGHNFTPSVLFAHLFYHSTTLLLFQPFINLSLNTSAVMPREVCYQAATAITGLTKSYADLYTLRRTPSFAPYFVLISTIIHLVAVKNDPTNEEMKKNLTQGLSDLKEMAKCHGLALKAIGALQYLSSVWGIDTSFGGASDLIDSDTSPIPGQFMPDVNILEVLRSIQPVLSSESPPILSPFPRQGQPVGNKEMQLEKDGFATVPRREPGN